MLFSKSFSVQHMMYKNIPKRCNKGKSENSTAFSNFPISAVYVFPSVGSITYRMGLWDGGTGLGPVL